MENNDLVYDWFDLIEDSKSYSFLLSETTEENLFKIQDETDEKIYSKYKKYFNSLLKHLKKELKINKPVKIVLEEDEENAKKVLGRTGGYINHKIKIHIYYRVCLLHTFYQKLLKYH